MQAGPGAPLFYACWQEKIEGCNYMFTFLVCGACADRYFLAERVSFVVIYPSVSE